jgi:N-acetylmuramoyl-L-alanine amidase
MGYQRMCYTIIERKMTMKKAKLSKVVSVTLLPAIIVAVGITQASRNVATVKEYVYETPQQYTAVIEEVAPSPEPQAPETSITINETMQKADSVIESATRIASRGESLRMYKESDVDLMARVMFGEAKGEDEAGIYAVGQVLLNRIEYHKTHPNSFADNIKGLLTFKQFNCVTNDFYTMSVPDKFYMYARKVLSGIEEPLPKNIVYFYNPKTATDSWIKTRKIFKKIGNHVFCYPESK